MFAVRDFAKGEILCDYHGKEKSKKKGLRKLERADKPANLFFFTDVDGKERCIDATADECRCHPDQKTLGRKITHSSKVYNVRPVLCRMLLDDVTRKETNVILFQATKNIKPSEKLLFNFGKKKKSYVGEGLDLTWLSD